MNKRVERAKKRMSENERMHALINLQKTNTTKELHQNKNLEISLRASSFNQTSKQN
jgi:hypothetical protein